MFNRNRTKPTMYNEIDDTRSTVYDFKLRISSLAYESYRTTEYKVYHKLNEDEMIPILDDKLNQMFAGEVDDGNGDMLDDIILSAAREGMQYLAKAHVDHRDSIHRFIVRRIADREDIERIRDAREEELETLNEDYAKVLEAISENKEEKLI